MKANMKVKLILFLSVALGIVYISMYTYSRKALPAVVDDARKELEHKGLYDKVAILAYDDQKIILGFYGKADPEVVEIVKAVIDREAPLGTPLEIVEDVTFTDQSGANGSVSTDQAVQLKVPADFPVDQAERLSVDELAERSEKMGELLLPTWMPGDIKLKEIYMWGGPMLVYSDRDVEHYRDGKITIEISQDTTSPTYDELRSSTGTSGEVVKIGELNVVIFEDAAPDPWMEAHGQRPIVIYLWHGGFYYGVTGIKGEVSKEQMIEVIAKMETIGPNTMRKQSG